MQDKEKGIKNIVFTESPIVTEIFSKHPRDYPLNSIVLAVDNDEAGKNFVRNVRNSYDTDFKLDLPTERKDWNEQLKKDKAITNGEPTYEKPKEQMKIIDNEKKL